MLASDPQLRADGLLGNYAFFDVQMDDRPEALERDWFVVRARQ